MMKKEEPKKQPSGMGIAIGLVVCGLILLAFPKFTDISIDWLIWAFYGIGLVIVLIGCLGFCSERFQ